MKEKERKVWRNKRPGRCKMLAYLCAAAATLLLTWGTANEVRADSLQRASTADEFYDNVIRMIESGDTKGEITISFEAGELSSDILRERAFEKGGYELESKFAFWSYTLSQQSTGTVVSFSTGYFLSDVHKKLVDTLADEIAEDCKGMTDYQKIKYVYDYIILNCEFESNKEGVYNNLFRGRSDRSGYADAFLTLMHRLNIPCKYTANASHAWNTVCLDGTWYNVDAMLGDTGGSGIDYNYFLKSNKDWEGMQPAEATAIVSYGAKDLEQRYEYPNYKLNAQLKVGKVILVPLGILLLVFLIVRLINGQTTRGQIADNEDKIRNLYKLPDD